MSDDLLPATRGAGPLLQRDYWAVLAGSPLSPVELIAKVKERFCVLPPASLVGFTAEQGIARGARLDIVITPGQRCAVTVIHEDEQSLTLGTLAGHPEAGRITFGAYRNPAADVIFHIRSRARSTTTLKRIGFLAIGDAMQTNTWTDFIRNVAALAGASIAGAIHADTETVEEGPEDDEPLHAPTFRAVGG
ncbi:MAG TPA: DUF1990 family protein [Vicinamibacterales bacterium]|nr:DUF1990 family protein [Vicinamibacterales bacterium]